MPLQRRSRHEEPEYRLARDSDAGADRQEVVDHRADRDGEEDDLQRPLRVALKNVWTRRPSRRKRMPRMRPEGTRRTSWVRRLERVGR